MTRYKCFISSISLFPHYHHHPMDNFINLAKQGYQTYQSSQGQGGQGSGQGQGGGDPSYGRTGGEEYNSPHHSQQGGGYGGPQYDHDEAGPHRAAGLTAPATAPCTPMRSHTVNQYTDQHNHPIDEDAAQDAHRQVYEQGSSGLPASSVGSAAALQAFKKFTSGGGGGGGGGGGSQTQLISMAMAEASKLFDQHGGGGGGKQDAVNGAAMTVTKLLVQSKFSGGTTGGGDSGGLGALAGLASKFM
ncbi:hypothetical protein DFH94DRAFT_416803 [Russula ochroleuca]|uniref:DUF7721 domain-containing protein n=1 Tax=Russula ochroleuca TaxID=152965 RepID=A0A9P5MYP1_9AGAM|nr:hypothetical protein DFH94DRAFT_416803 [Russula ochroleuca]